MDVKKLSLNFYQHLKKQNITKPIVLISGGETTVNIKGNGKGGRNQEFALHFLKVMKINYLNKNIFYFQLEQMEETVQLMLLEQ